MTRPPLVVITDLDGTLLDHDTYSFADARSALGRLKAERIPLVLCTSKTRAETERIRAALGNDHPFIVENGGGIVVPHGYFAFPIDAERTEDRDRATIIAIGEPYEDLVATLAHAASRSGVRVSGFAQMTDTDVAEATGLSLDDARLARQREFDEPFELLDDTDPSPLLDAIVRAGKQWTVGGRFYHITGASDKARAASVLAGLYRRQLGEITTVGLGDAPNDAAFLRAVDIPIVIASPRSSEVASVVPGAVVTRFAGAKGWNDAIVEMLGGTP